MKNEKWDDVHGNTTPDDRMVAFLESPTDSYAILQLREDVDDNIPLMFANYSYLQKKEMEPEIDRYEVVYADIMASTYGLPEMARMLGVHRQTIYYIVANEDFELIKVGRYKRATKESFEKWYHNQTRYQLAEDRQERS